MPSRCMWWSKKRATARWWWCGKDSTQRYKELCRGEACLAQFEPQRFNAKDEKLFMSVIQVTADGPVTIITITRPHRRNAINAETARALREAWLAFDADDSQRVGILTGGDEVFCAGADLKE